MSIAPVTSVPAHAMQLEPTHRFGRPLDDRLPAAGGHPAGIAQTTPATSADEIVTSSVAGVAEDTDGFSFADLLDIVNPLQHLPVVSTLYREATGDEIRPESKVLGGGLFGGLIGAASSLVDVAIESMTGDTVGGHVMTALFGDDADTEEPAEPVDVAARDAALSPAIAMPAAATTTRPAPAAPLPSPRSSQAEQAGASKAATQQAPGTPLPALSAAAFDALLNSFGAPANDVSQPGAPIAAYAGQQRAAGTRIDTAF